MSLAMSYKSLEGIVVMISDGRGFMAKEKGLVTEEHNKTVLIKPGLVAQVSGWIGTFNLFKDAITQLYDDNWRMGARDNLAYRMAILPQEAIEQYRMLMQRFLKVHPECAGREDLITEIQIYASYKFQDNTNMICTSRMQLLLYPPFVTYDDADKEMIVKNYRAIGTPSLADKELGKLNRLNAQDARAYLLCILQRTMEWNSCVGGQTFLYDMMPDGTLHSNYNSAHWAWIYERAEDFR